MNKKVIRRLGERLDHLFEWVGRAESYDNIWDLCCDHGRLGLHLHERHKRTDVYLVDRVDQLIDRLVADYSWKDDGRLYFRAADVGQLNIIVRHRTLVIIAGIGGENLITMLQSILSRMSQGQTIEFMLSPNTHIFELRRFLQKRHFGLIDEAFITEKGKCHEHLWLSYEKGTILGADQIKTQVTSQIDDQVIDSAQGGDLCERVSVVGDRLWSPMTDIKRSYIRKLLAHYQRRQDNNDSVLSQMALNAYGCLL